jgi:TfoX/Sxy family transcriptional regulator of competence genes
MTHIDQALQKIELLKERGHSIKQIEQMAGISNGLAGKVLNGKVPMSQSFYNKIMAIETGVDVVAQKQYTEPLWVSVLAKYMSDKGIVYTDLIEAYESNARHYENATKDLQPKFVPQSETDAYYGWTKTEFKNYYDTVVSRAYTHNQFYNIIQEESNNIELLKLFCEIKKSPYIQDEYKAKLQVVIYNKLKV